MHIKRMELFLTFLPEEIFNILNSMDLNELPDDDNDIDNLFDVEQLKEKFKSMMSDTDFWQKDIISGYLTMNDVIEKSVLKELLSKNHDIDLSISDIDKYVEELGHASVGVYYSLFGDQIDGFSELIELKKNVGKYKPYNMDISFVEDDFLDSVDDCVADIVSDDDSKEDLSTYIIFLMKTGCFNKDSLNNLNETIGLKEYQKRKILDSMKPYKNTISIWTFNGFSINDMNEKNSSGKKIGRNEPCPCGSGKKYKQCCGK